MSNLSNKFRIKKIVTKIIGMKILIFIFVKKNNGIQKKVKLNKLKAYKPKKFNTCKVSGSQDQL